MGALTVRICIQCPIVHADKMADNEFVQLMMQK